MERPFTYKAAKDPFACGNTYSNLTVVNFVGPFDTKVTAYCCNMNLDLDGEPQVYGPLSKNPIESWDNGGWKSAAKNAAKKPAFDEAKKLYDDLQKKKLELTTPASSSTPPAPAPPAPGGSTPQPPITLGNIDAKITTATNNLVLAAGLDPHEPDLNAKNFGKIFWHWYGVASLSPTQKRSYYLVEKSDKKVRHPEIDTNSELEDVYGRFPVIQSAYEPGPGFYVSVMPKRVNAAFPLWDQRAFLPPDEKDQVPNAALTTKLGEAAGLVLRDRVFAIRLDTGATLTMPFLDIGFDFKVGECSIGAFTSLGGIVKRPVTHSDNSFLLLYLAFPKLDPSFVLNKFALASNAADFPVLLAFIAQATIDAKTKGYNRVTGDPIQDFQKWKKSASTLMPSSFNTISDRLSEVGFNPAAARFLSRHPSVLPGHLNFSP
jgi:hypothetical protein